MGGTPVQASEDSTRFPRSARALVGGFALMVLVAVSVAAAVGTADSTRSPSRVRAAATTAPPHPTFSVSAQSAAAGSTIEVSGTNCVLDGIPLERASVRLVRHPQVTESPFDNLQYYPVQPDGSWAGVYQVPPEAPPDTDYELEQYCRAADFTIGGVTLPFEVTPGPPPSSTTTTTTITPTTDATTPTTSGALPETAAPVETEVGEWVTLVDVARPAWEPEILLDGHPFVRVGYVAVDVGSVRTAVERTDGAALLFELFAGDEPIRVQVLHVSVEPDHLVVYGETLDAQGERVGEASLLLFGTEWLGGHFVVDARDFGITNLGGGVHRVEELRRSGVEDAPALSV